MGGLQNLWPPRMKAKPTLHRVVGDKGHKDFLCRDMVEWNDMYGKAAPVKLLGSCDVSYLIAPLILFDDTADTYGARFES